MSRGQTPIVVRNPKSARNEYTSRVVVIDCASGSSKTVNANRLPSGHVIAACGTGRVLSDPILIVASLSLSASMARTFEPESNWIYLEINRYRGVNGRNDYC